MTRIERSSAGAPSYRPSWGVQAACWILRQLAGGYLRVEVAGREHIPRQGGLIIACNHPNLLDGLLLQAFSPRPVRFLVAEELFFHRHLHRLFFAFGCIPVYRTRSSNGDALRAALAALEQGDVIGIFPEGTTAFRGSMERLRRGVALLAVKTGAAVVPMAIAGTFEAYPPGQRVPRPSVVRMRFAAPVAYPRETVPRVPDERVHAVLADIRSNILQVMRALAQTPSARKLEWLKGLSVAASALVVWPLANLLVATANPSLDPHEGG